MEIRSEPAPSYTATHAEIRDDAIVAQALAIIERRFTRQTETLSNPATVREFLILRLCEHEREVFGVIYLDTRHRVIAVEDLFFGAIDGAAVYPREVVKSAMRHNAAATIIFHNHPSGVAEPSAADELLTGRLKSALALVDVRLLDHIVVGGATTVSLAERGMV